MPEQQIPIRLYKHQAPISIYERNRKGHTFGELTPDQLVTILSDAKDGNIEQWIELCAYALQTDLHLQSLIETRKSRVIGDGNFYLTPGKSVDPASQAMAKKAADFCEIVLNDIEEFNTTKMLSILDAIGHGVSCHELIWGRSNGANVIKDIQWVHARRFRWDEDWNLRLYDYGSRMEDGQYGEELQPDCWLVHNCRFTGSYPGEAGILRSCIWPWLFKMWVNRYHIHATERYGQPFITASVPSGSETSVRNNVLSKLEQLSYDTVGVFEEGTQIVFEGGPSKANNGEMFEKYLDRADRNQTKAVLGATDIVDPGIHGSQSAVETRTEATLDPRTLVDRSQVASRIQKQILGPLIRLNLHLWNGAIPPEPKFHFGVRKAENTYAVKGPAQVERQVSQPVTTSVQDEPKKKLNRSHSKISTQRTFSFSTNPLEKALSSVSDD